MEHVFVDFEHRSLTELHAYVDGLGARDTFDQEARLSPVSVRRCAAGIAAPQLIALNMAP